MLPGVDPAIKAPAPHRARNTALAPEARWLIGACLSAAMAMNLATWWRSMAKGVRALEEL